MRPLVPHIGENIDVAAFRLAELGLEHLIPAPLHGIETALRIDQQYAA